MIADLQFMFDHIADHLLSQGEKSMRSGLCMYRGEQGLQCAVGCMLPDLDATRLESGVPAELIEPSSFLEEFREIMSTNLGRSLAAKCQRMHDDASPRGWLLRLALIAEHFDLDPSILVTWIDDEVSP